MRPDELWNEYRAAHPEVAEGYDVVSFGDSPALADELAELVVHGPKRATAGSLRSFEAGEENRSFEAGEENLPVVGGHVVLVDGAGQARAVWRTTEVTVKPLDQVDAAFAWDEGEGDRSRAYWLDAHRSYFRRECERAGVPFDEAMPTVFERFAVVWPVAD